jgi:hypothetical protein
MHNWSAFLVCRWSWLTILICCCICAENFLVQKILSICLYVSTWFVLAGKTYIKSVDRPPPNPKRIIIHSSQECFSVDIPRVPMTSISHKATHADDDDDDFMPVMKKRNLIAVLQNWWRRPLQSERHVSIFVQCQYITSCVKIRCMLK